MSKIVKLNQISIKTERDAMEFIDVITAKLPAVKKVLSKHLLEKQSLFSELDSLRRQVSTGTKTYVDPNASVSERVNNPPETVQRDEGADRLAQLRQAQEPKPPVDPGEIGELDLNSTSDLVGPTGVGAEEYEIGMDFGADNPRPDTQPKPEDMVSIGQRVSGKAESFENANRRREKAQAGNDLRKK